MKKTKIESMFVNPYLSMLIVNAKNEYFNLKNI